MKILRKLSGFVALSFRHSLSERGEIVGRGALYVMLLFVFSRLWKTIGDEQGSGWTNFLWYLALTEWVLLSIPNLHLDIEADVRSGDIVTALPRPISYIAAKVAEGVGSALARLGVLGVLGVCVAWIFTGVLPDQWGSLWQAIPTGVLGVTLGVFCGAIVGMSALWVQDVNPLYWAWHKTLFIFGGLLVPLDLYPMGLQKFAAWTPCHALLYGTGSRVLEQSPWSLAAVLTRQGLWLLVTAALLWVCYERALRRIDVNGG